MTELRQSNREALKTVATSTLTGSLHKRGLRNMFLQDVQPLRVDQARMVGIAYTMRFIPFREDMTPPRAR
jgi:regulator of RNase E activity RraA